MTWSKLKNLNKKVFLCLFAIFTVFSNSFAEDWVLAAKKFEFAQKKKRDVSEEELSSLIPQLLLEQISEGLVRKTSSKEMMNRTLESYLVERQSLFLQLSKEYKKRDSLVLTTDNKKKLDKAIRNQQKVIKEIEEKIEDNLNRTEQIKSEYNELMEKENGKVKAESDFSLFFNPFTNLFVTKKENLLPETADERITLYKNDSSQLYVPGTSYLTNGLESRSFEKEIVGAKINGLIDGSLTVYGEYFSVTCSLYLYPGRERLGTITEVGKVRNCGNVVTNIAAYFCPKITNRMPVEIYFEVQPAEIIDKTHVTVDGIFFEKIPPVLKLDAGNHTVKVECQDYYTRMITYEFTGADKFLIQADMKEQTKTNVSVALVKPEEGKIYADGKFAGEIFSDNFYGKFTSTGEPVIGHFMADRKDKSGESASFFYYVPENILRNDAVLAVNGKAMDHASYIDRRRIWTYRAYTLLLLSMPFTLYYTGQYNSAVYAFNSRSMKDLDEIYRLKDARNVSLCVTAVCTGFFVIELVRYLIAANSVLPANAHKASNYELRKAEKRAAKMALVIENVPDKDENIETVAEDATSEESTVENAVPGDTK